MKILGERKVFNGFLFRLKKVEVEHKNKKKTIELVETKPVVMIVAVDKDNKILLLKEYSFAHQEYEYALPKGLVEENESLKEAALRELAEETGFSAKNIRKILTLRLLSKYMTTETHIFLATDLFENQRRGDELEKPKVVKVDLKEAKDMIINGKIKEARVVASLLVVDDILKRKSRK